MFRKAHRMTLWQSIIFGLVQGLTEFLPVSSSGHIAIAEALLGTDLGESSLAFTVLLHAGTLAAVLFVYARDVLGIIRAVGTFLPKLFRGKFRLSEADPDERMLILVVIATLPLVPAILLKDKIEFVAGDIRIVGGILIVNAIVLFLAGVLPKGGRPPEKAGIRHALTVGAAQVFALFPGLSRSGTTISAGLFCGFEKEYAAKFSFIMSIPAVLGACALDLPGFISETLSSGDVRQTAIYLAGALTAAVSGVGAIRLLVLVAKKNKFIIFSLYSLAVGAAAITAGSLG